MIHYKDIESDLDIRQPNDSPEDRAYVLLLRALHCIAQDLDSITAIFREYVAISQKLAQASLQALAENRKASNGGKARRRHTPK